MTQTDQQADKPEHRQTLSSRHALPTKDFLGAAILPQSWRVITPTPPGYYSSKSPKGLRIRGRQPYRHTRHIRATPNYSNPILNYSDKMRKASAIIGREDNRVTGSNIPAIDIYYYCTTGKDKYEITPIPLHRKYVQTWRSLLGDGDHVLSVTMSLEMSLAMSP